MQFRKKIISAAAILLSAVLFSLLYSSGGDYVLYMISGKNGVMRSDNNGRSWSQFNGGLPKDAEAARLYGFSGKNEQRIYLATIESGLYKLDGGKWISLNSGLFRSKRVYKSEGKYRKISAFAEDDQNPRRIFAATKHSVFESSDSGNSWKPFELNGVHPRNYITSIAVSGEKIAVGTSFNGVFVKSGNKFFPRVQGLYREPYEAKLSFTEEIVSLAWAGAGKTLLAGLNFGGGAYQSGDGGAAWKRIDDVSADNNTASASEVRGRGEDIFFSMGSSVSRILSGKKTESFSMQKIFEKIDGAIYPESVLAVEGSDRHPPLTFYLNRFADDRKNKIADNKKAVYVSLKMLKNINYVYKVVSLGEFNSVVIDMKDDAGNICFEASADTAREIGAERPQKWIPDALKKLKKKNIYLIARMVVFKDMKLFRGYGHRHAIKTLGSGAPWRGTEHEYWVDPFSEFARDYNISLARDVEALGFDEIQFDYIRFPSDGGVHRCAFSHMKNAGAYKSEAITDFLLKAKDSLRVPVSVDIFGFNSWYLSGNWIGQDIEEISRAADVICPMVYPSHFGRIFYQRIDYRERPYKIIYDGGIRSVRLVKNRAVIRPYLQAFRMLSPGWGPDYIRAQAKGAIDSGCGGFIFWNAKGEYDTVVQSFSGR